MYIAGVYPTVFDSIKRGYWLDTKEPELYLLNKTDLLTNGEEDCRDKIITFFSEALKEDIPNLIIEIPFIPNIRFVKEHSQKQGIILQGRRPPIVYFKRAATDWKSSEFLCELSWKEIPIIWDKKWFLDSIEKKLKKNLLQKKLIEIGIKSFFY